MNLILLLVLLSFFTGLNAAPVDNMSEGIEFPDHPSFNTGCQNRTEVPETMMKLHLKHKPTNLGIGEHWNRDISRIQAFHQRIVEKKKQDTVSRRTEPRRRLVASQVPRRKPGIAKKEGEPAGQLTATLVSGFSLGSVEYLMDVFIGTPPKRFSLILDTGSDLNWIQCLPFKESSCRPLEPSSSKAGLTRALTRSDGWRGRSREKRGSIMQKRPENG